MDDLTTL